MLSLKSPAGVLVTVSEEKAQALIGQGFTLVESTDEPSEPPPTRKPTRRTTKG